MAAGAVVTDCCGYSVRPGGFSVFCFLVLVGSKWVRCLGVLVFDALFNGFGPIAFDPSKHFEIVCRQTSPLGSREDWMGRCLVAIN